MLAPNPNRKITEQLKSKQPWKKWYLAGWMVAPTFIMFLAFLFACEIRSRSQYIYYLCIGVYSLDRHCTHSHIIYLTICYIMLSSSPPLPNRCSSCVRYFDFVVLICAESKMTLTKSKMKNDKIIDYLCEVVKWLQIIQ